MRNARIEEIMVSVVNSPVVGEADERQPSIWPKVAPLIVTQVN